MKTTIQQDGYPDLEIEDIEKDVIQIWQQGATEDMSDVILVEKDKIKELIQVLISII